MELEKVVDKPLNGDHRSTKVQESQVIHQQFETFLGATQVSFTRLIAVPLISSLVNCNI